MAGRELEAVERAVARYQAGESVAAAAYAESISTATLQRGLNRRGVAKRGALTGADHPSYTTGRFVNREAAADQRRQDRRAALEHRVQALAADPAQAEALKRAAASLHRLTARM